LSYGNLIFEYGHAESEVGRYLYHGSPGVSLAVKRGEKYLKEECAAMRWIREAMEKQQATFPPISSGMLFANQLIP